MVDEFPRNVSAAGRGRHVVGALAEPQRKVGRRKRVDGEAEFEESAQTELVGVAVAAEQLGSDCEIEDQRLALVAHGGVETVGAGVRAFRLLDDEAGACRVALALQVAVVGQAVVVGQDPLDGRLHQGVDAHLQADGHRQRIFQIDQGRTGGAQVQVIDRSLCENKRVEIDLKAEARPRPGLPWTRTKNCAGSDGNWWSVATQK